MSKPRRTMGTGAILLALVIAAAAVSPAHAQDATPNRERLTQFARAHMSINEARDAFHGQVARVHDEEGRRRAREEVDARIADILEEHELTKEEYDAFILQISLDGDLRATFEELLVQLAEQPTG
jgi:hypothetical protein